MDNEYAAVYITGWEPEDGGLSIEYVAVSRCDRPLLLVLPGEYVVLDGAAYRAELKDGFGAYATLMGYIPVENWGRDKDPQFISLQLALADPTEWDDPILEGTEVNFIQQNETGL